MSRRRRKVAAGNHPGRRRGGGEAGERALSDAQAARRQGGAIHSALGCAQFALNLIGSASLWARPRNCVNRWAQRGMNDRKGAPMQDQAGRGQPAKENYRGWQSDVIVDLITSYGFPNLPLKPR